jgi:hypothetical protein
MVNGITMVIAQWWVEEITFNDRKPESNSGARLALIATHFLKNN